MCWILIFLVFVSYIFMIVIVSRLDLDFKVLDVVNILSIIFSIVNGCKYFGNRFLCSIVVIVILEVILMEKLINKIRLNIFRLWVWLLDMINLYIMIINSVLSGLIKIFF